VDNIININCFGNSSNCNNLWLELLPTIE
jgi:hypothetical protein